MSSEPVHSAQPGSSAVEYDGDEREETLFALLAERARGHPPAHLWGATLFGAADAAAIMVAYPAAWWIASAAVVLCAFGVWGLADEALIDDAFQTNGPGRRILLRAIRGGALAVGTLASLTAAFGLMAAMLGRLIS